MNQDIWEQTLLELQTILSLSKHPLAREILPLIWAEIEDLPLPSAPLAYPQVACDVRAMLTPEVIEMLRTKQAEEPNPTTRYWLDIVDNKPILRLNTEMIERARLYPILNLVQPIRGMIKCPFHAEKTGSCKVYTDNHFNCFGCGARGDVIDLYMQINSCTFKEAVIYLSQ